MAEPTVTGEADTPEAIEAHRAFAMGAPVNPEPPKDEPAPEAPEAPQAPVEDPAKENQTETDPATGGDNQTPPPVPKP